VQRQQPPKSSASGRDDEHTMSKGTLSELKKFEVTASVIDFLLAGGRLSSAPILPERLRCHSFNYFGYRAKRLLPQAGRPV